MPNTAARPMDTATEIVSAKQTIMVVNITAVMLWPPRLALRVKAAPRGGLMP